MMYVLNYGTSIISALRVRNDPEDKASCPLVELVEEFQPSLGEKGLPDHDAASLNDIIATDDRNIYIVVPSRTGERGAIIHMQPSGEFSSIFNDKSTRTQTSLTTAVFVKSGHKGQQQGQLDRIDPPICWSHQRQCSSFRFPHRSQRFSRCDR